MFVRIDRDLSVNIGNIFSYKLSEDVDSYKLQIWSNTGSIIHTVIYLKSRPEQMKILIEFNNVMRDLTTNLDIVGENNFEDMMQPEEIPVEEPKERKIEEQLQLDI